MSTLMNLIANEFNQDDKVTVRLATGVPMHLIFTWDGPFVCEKHVHQAQNYL